MPIKFITQNEGNARAAVPPRKVSVLLATFAILFFTPSVQAQRKSRPAPPSFQVNHDCGNGIQLTLSSAAANQGALLLARVRSAKPLRDIKGQWDTREIPFWKDESAQAKAAGTKFAESWEALLGVDLERSPGSYEFSLTLQPASVGEPVAWAVQITVKDGKFATENLHVEKQFVTPDPEQLARAKAEQQRLRDLFDRVTPERLWQGRFQVPLTGVKIGGNFGRRRILNGQPSSPHTGVDFPAPAGTPVHATQRGKVVLAEPLYFSGNTIILDHGLGIYTLYGHLQIMNVVVGQTVGAGEVIGKVGATGRVTGPHLHWGLTVHRARVNALQIINLPVLR